MTLHLIEGALTALSAYLQSAMPAKLTALNAEYADAYTLDAIGTWSIAEVVEAQTYPVIEMLGARTVRIGEDGSSLNAQHAVAVVCTVREDTSVTALRTKVYRYARALVEVLKASVSAPAGLGYVVQWGEPLVDFSPAFTLRGRSRVVANCVVSVLLQKREVG